MPEPESPPPRSSLLATLFRPFARVEPDEVLGVTVLTLTVFLLLTAYYLLKTAREPLILLQGGAKWKSFAAAFQSGVLLLTTYVYGEVAKRVGRMKLLASVYLFFVATFAGFAALALIKAPIGIVFFIWVGVFNVTAIAQFWSFAADVYTPEQGKRLFAVVGIGSSVGAVVGSQIAKLLVPLGPAFLMGGAAAVLVVCVFLFAFMNARFEAKGPSKAAKDAEKPLADERAIHLLFRDRYLLLIAASLLLLNWVNSNGEYVLDKTILAAVEHLGHDEQEKFIGAFKADYFSYTNALGVTLQLFAVSRILRVFGVRRALLLLPAASAVAYSILLFRPALEIVRVAKVIENGIDYSVQSTTQQTLYLVTSRVEKYVGKSLVDTLFVRLGDVFSFLTVLGGEALAFSTHAFAVTNLVLIGIWVVVLLAIGRENTRRADEEPELLAQEPVRA
jgi:AAA family ATP:ADP antiporter